MAHCILTVETSLEAAETLFCWPQRSEHCGFYSCKEVNPNNNYLNLVRSFRWDQSPGDTLTSALWDPAQRAQLSSDWTPDPWKIWVDECVLFQAARFRVTCYAARKNEDIPFSIPICCYRDSVFQNPLTRIWLSVGLFLHSNGSVTKTQVSHQ